MISGEKQPYLGLNVSPTVIAEIDYRGLLGEGEQLLAVFDGMLLDEGGRKVGGLAMTDYLVLSDQRLITWARGLWTDIVDGFGWHDVELLDAECWDPYHGRITFCFHLPAPEPDRPQRKVSVRGPATAAAGDGTAALNIFDVMPAEDVPVATEMLQWLPERMQSGDLAELASMFAAAFPAPPRQPRPRMATSMVAPAPAPAEAPKSRWPFGLGRSEPQAEATPHGLVNAYERQRTGGPAAAPGGELPLLRGGMAQPPEQPSMYEISRGIRVVMQHRDKVGPMMGRITRAMARMSEVVGGTADLVENMRDPDVRRVAGAGLRQAMGQQGAAATVGAIARASRRRDDDKGDPGERSSRRIEVRSGLRAQSEPEAQGLRAQPQPQVEVRSGLRPQALREDETPDPIRRRSVSRIEPVAGSGSGSLAEPEEPATDRITVPIRRMVVRTRNNDEA